MKLAYTCMQTVIDTDISEVNTLVVENSDYFRTFLQEIVNQINGESGGVTLSVNNAPVDIPKYLEVLDRFVPFDINKKSLLTKIMAALERASMNETNLEPTQRLMAEIENWADTIAFSELCDIMCTKVSASTILRAIGVELIDDYDSLGEKILDYMGLVREYDRDKLFLLVNLRSYLSSKDVELFLHDVLTRGFHVVLLDSHDYDRVLSERRIVVDADLCEF